jgi:enterochelin esterase-like enzyme
MKTIQKFILSKIQSHFIGKALITLMIVSAAQTLFAQDTINPPPSGYDSHKSGIAHGTTKIDTFYSSVVGASRRTRIILPPGYNKDSTYNVLYLLHGIGGDINEWYSNGAPLNILDNLYARSRIAPMIVVLPNGRAMLDDSPGSNIYAADKVAGFANFEFELIKDLVPYIDTTYPVKRENGARAIAGLSMGGGQSLNFGLAHLDTFAWVGAFSPAPNTKDTASLFPDFTADTAKLSGLWISCGDADGLFYISQNTHKFLKNNHVKHYFKVEPGKGHDWSVWKPGLYYFAQRIFGRVAQMDTIPKAGISQNPYESEFNISYDQSNQTITILGNNIIKKLSIYDINGRLIISDSKIRNNMININKLSNGVYLVTIFNGKRNLNAKVLKF